jgi:hypothetical protein
VGQRETVSSDAILVDASAGHSGSLEEAVALPKYYEVGRRDRTFINSMSNHTLNLSYSEKKT